MSAKTGIVYRALAADGTVLYVGMTTRLKRRLYEHSKKSAWWPLHATIERDRALPLDAASLAEADQIARLCPRFNQIGGIVERFGPDQTTEREWLDWKARYETGATIEEIALDAHASQQTVRKHLLSVGTEMRRPGGQAGKAPGNLSRRAESPRDAVVRVAFAGARSTHRRRGGKRAA